MSEGITADLPIELLGEVFIQCLPPYRHALYNDLTWIAPSQVCRQWRHAALACRKLWARGISFASPFWTYTALQRAADAPLSFDIDLDRTDLYFAITIVSLYIHRTQELMIRGVSPQLHKFLQHFTQSPAPLLETLYIHVHDLQGDETEDVPYIPSLFSSEDRCPHRLKMLSLEGCCSSPKAAMYAGITAFSMWESSRQVWKKIALLDIIQAMPHLREFSVGPVEDIRIQWPSAHSVTLPANLMHLKFCQSDCRTPLPEGYGLQALLPCLRLSSNWTCTPCLHNPGDMHVVLAWVLQYFDQGVGAGLEIRLETEFPESERDNISVEISSKGKVMKMSLFTPPSSRTEILCDILLRVRGYHVVTMFRIRGFHGLDASTQGCSPDKLLPWWYKRLDCVVCWRMDRLPPALLLEAIFLRLMLSIGIDTRFEEPSSAYDDDGRIVLIFPNLKRVHIEDMDLSATLVGYHKGIIEDREGQLLHLILMIVWAYAERRRLKVAGGPIPRVTIRDCENVDVGAIHALRGLTDVEWDGKGATRCTDYEDVRTAVLFDFTGMFAREELE